MNYFILNIFSQFFCLIIHYNTMDIFYIIVLSIASIILILLLTYVGINMKSSINSSTTFPPTKSTCPDYWVADNSGCKIPADTARNAPTSINSTGLPGYDSVRGSINFSDAGWSVGGMASVCAQKKWANQSGIVWDGVTNYNGC